MSRANYVEFTGRTIGPARISLGADGQPRLRVRVRLPWPSELRDQPGVNVIEIIAKGRPVTDCGALPAGTRLSGEAEIAAVTAPQPKVWFVARKLDNLGAPAATPGVA